MIEVLHRGLRRELVLGYCSVIDCNWKPRVFLIEIQSGLNEEVRLKKLKYFLIISKRIKENKNSMKSISGFWELDNPMKSLYNTFVRFEKIVYNYY